MGHSPNTGAQNVTVSATGGAGGVALFTTATPHLYKKNQPVILGGGAAPTGFTAGTTYYVSPTANYTTTTFTLSATPSGASIAASDAGTTVTVSYPTGSFRVLRIHKRLTEQYLFGQANAAAAKASAAEGGATNAEKFWLRRSVHQFIGTPNEDEFEYVVSAADDGT